MELALDASLVNTSGRTCWHSALKIYYPINKKPQVVKPVVDLDENEQRKSAALLIQDCSPNRDKQQTNQKFHWEF